MTCIEFSSNSGWDLPPQDLKIGAAEVHVWLAPLDLPLYQLPSLASTLDASECSRAAQYRFERDRRHFIAAHGTLRTILGTYLNIAPPNLKFAYNSYGKPFLTAGTSQALQFNISHSNTRLLIAIARNLQLGVDIEYVHPLSDIATLASTVFSPHERSGFEATDAMHQQQVFYTCWTRKEGICQSYRPWNFLSSREL